VTAFLALAACGSPQQPFASDEEVAAVSFRNEGGPYEIKVFTVINSRTGSGGHTSLLIAASERIIFDPAGSFHARGIPEQEDVLFGISPIVEETYVKSHARSTHYTRVQAIEVTAEQAEIAYRLAISNGPVAGAFCAQASSSLLRQVPGFESITPTFYPLNLSEQFAQIPGVVTVERRDDYDPRTLRETLDSLN